MKNKNKLSDVLCIADGEIKPLKMYADLKPKPNMFEYMVWCEENGRKPDVHEWAKMHFESQDEGPQTV